MSRRELPRQLLLEEATPGHCWDTTCTWDLCCVDQQGFHGHVAIKAPDADMACVIARQMVVGLAEIRGVRHVSGKWGTTPQRRRRGT